MSTRMSRSWRASPGGSSALRPSCTRRSVLVKVPVFSGKAEAGSTTSAYQAVSVRKMSCTTRCSRAARAPRACAEVRVGHGRVLAHDVHAPHLARVDGVHDLHDGEARAAVERRLFHSASNRCRAAVVVHPLVVRQHHGNEARVRRALDVVLAAQRMQPGAGAADLAGHQGQVDEAARVVGAVHVLGHAHAPEDHGGARGGIDTRHLAQHAGVDAADGRHALGAEGCEVLAQCVEALGARGDEVPRRSSRSRR